MITMIWANDIGGVIGNNNALPWKNQKGDMKFFKETTTGRTVVMGRKTFESMGKKPLPDRINIVLTRDFDYDAGDALVANSLEDILSITDCEEVFVIGGCELYNMFMPYADRILETTIGGFHDGDTFSPLKSTKERQWQLVSQTYNEADEDNDFPYVFGEWVLDKNADFIDVYFVSKDTKTERRIGTIKGKGWALKVVGEFLEDRDWDAPYWRWNQVDEELLTIDVGSHNEQFELRWRKKHN